MNTNKIYKKKIKQNKTKQNQTRYYRIKKDKQWQQNAK